MNDPDSDTKRRAWTKIFSGRATTVKLEGNIVRYGDHVTRMQSLADKRPEKLHFFKIPEWQMPQDFVALNIHDIASDDKNKTLENVLNSLPEEDRRVLTQKLEGFEYENLEGTNCGHRPLDILLPKVLEDIQKRGFNMKADGSFQSEMSMLHMPMKLS